MAILVMYTGLGELERALQIFSSQQQKLSHLQTLVIFSAEQILEQLPAEVMAYPIAEEQQPNVVAEAMETALLALAERYAEAKIYYLLEESSEPSAMILLVKLIEVFPDRLQCVFVGHEQPGFAFGEANHHGFVERLFLSYVESCNYLGLQGLVNRGQLSVSLAPYIQELVRFKEFGFSKGTGQMLQALNAKTELYPQLKVYLPAIKEMQQLLRYEQKAFIKALFFNCKLEYEQADFVDFLVRYLRLLEELVIFALGWDDQYGNLVYKVGGRTGQRVNLPVKELSRLLGAFGKNQRAKQKYPRVYAYLTSDPVQRLVQMRHLSVGGHGFAGVNQAVLTSIYPGNIVADLHLVIESLGINVDHNYYDVLNAFLLEDYYALKGRQICPAKICETK